MADKIFFIPQQPIVAVQERNRITARERRVSLDGRQEDSISFEEVLKKQVSDQNKIRFSGHAQQRLRLRNINFSEEQIERLSDAVERAAQKGARDSLLLVDNIAAVVSVENRTVVTVVDGTSLRDNVFTNIDSAVIA